jgi:hypothetical protein
MTKTNSHLITSHSCHQWIFRLTRNMITKFLKNLYRERYIAGSSNWTTRELSITIATILSAVTGGLQSSSDKVYLCSSFKQIWILTILWRPSILSSFNSRFYSRKFHVTKTLTSTDYKPFLLKIHKGVKGNNLRGLPS